MEWISVNDRLPDMNANGENVEFLIAIRYGYDEPTEPYTICCGYLQGGNWWSYTEHNCSQIGHKTDNFNSGDADKVDYWMQLPESPKQYR